MSLVEDLSTYPMSPGVYLMKNSAGTILYVGKAKDLRRRLRSYFQPEKRLTPKTRVLMSKVETIDFMCTATEKEALLLEASLIKKHRPRYNIVLRDDKQYVLFRLGREHPYPALRVVRKTTRDGALYFGPFTSAFSAREAKRVIDRLFPLRKCRDTAFSNRVRPCLQHHIGRCLAPCCLPVSPEKYQQIVRQVEVFLSGRSSELVADLRQAMQEASERLDFEQAARLRDSLRALQDTIERQAAVLTNGRDLDALGLHAADAGVSLALMFVRQGQIIDSRAFWFPDAEAKDTEAVQQLCTTFLTQYYTEGRLLPERIITPFGVSEETSEALSDVRGKRVRVSKARGNEEQRLVEIAIANAKEHVPRQARLSPEDLGRALGLSRVERLECVDISHIHGEGTRAGMVVFAHGQPLSEDFRVYSFPELEGSGDDYLALALFAARRVQSGPPWPDVLLIDGGKGQLHAVERAVGEEGAAGLFPLAAIAKGETRRAGELGDVVFMPGRKNPINLKPGSPELLFLQQVRDAAHRFVISRLRQHKRTKQLHSNLEELPGIGPKTAALLWQHFASLEAMRQADSVALAAIPGIGPRKAAQLYKVLQELADC